MQGPMNIKFTSSSSFKCRASANKISYGKLLWSLWPAV